MLVVARPRADQIRDRVDRRHAAEPSHASRCSSSGPVLSRRTHSSRSLARSARHALASPTSIMVSGERCRAADALIYASLRVDVILAAGTRRETAVRLGPWRSPLRAFAARSATRRYMITSRPRLVDIAGLRQACQKAQKPRSPSLAGIACVDRRNDPYRAQMQKATRPHSSVRVSHTALPVRQTLRGDLGGERARRGVCGGPAGGSAPHP
jgi:hypothetical protein